MDANVGPEELATFQQALSSALVNSNFVETLQGYVGQDDTDKQEMWHKNSNQSI